MRAICLWAFLVFVCSVPVDAQSIETDRPDQTETSWTVPEGTVQLESGVAHEWGSALLEIVTGYRVTTSGLLARVGVVEGVEARLSLEHQYNSEDVLAAVPTIGLGDESARRIEAGLAAVAIGAKVGLMHESGLLPEGALIAHAMLPVGAAPFRPRFVTPDVRFSASHTLADAVGLGYNLGMEWEDGLTGASFVYTLTVGADVFDDTSGYVEIYGSTRLEGGQSTALDGGVTWRPADNVQLDISGGIGLTTITPDAMIGVGASIRIPQ